MAGLNWYYKPNIPGNTTSILSNLRNEHLLSHFWFVCNKQFKSVWRRRTSQRKVSVVHSFIFVRIWYFPVHLVRQHGLLLFQNCIWSSYKDSAMPLDIASFVLYLPALSERNLWYLLHYSIDELIDRRRSLRFTSNNIREAFRCWRWSKSVLDRLLICWSGELTKSAIALIILGWKLSRCWFWRVHPILWVPQPDLSLHSNIPLQGRKSSNRWLNIN